MPTGGVFGTGATDFFCSAVETGSRGLAQLLRDPVLTLLLLGAVSGSRGSSRSSARRGARSRRSASPVDAPGGRPPPPPGGCTSSVPRSSSGSALLFIPLAIVDRRPAGAPSRGARPARHRHDRESAGALVFLRGVALGTDPDAARARARAGGHVACSRRDRRRPLDRPDRGLSAGRSSQTRTLPRRSRPSPSARGSRSPRGAVLLPVAIWLVDSLGPARPGRRARRPLGLGSASVAAPSSCVTAGCASHRSSAWERGARTRRRPVTRRPADHPHGRAAAPAQRDRGHRVRARHAVRGPRDGVRLLRRRARKELEPEQAPDVLPAELELS